MTPPMRTWGPRRMSAWLAALDEDVVEVHPGAAVYCQSCGNELNEVVYSGSVLGVVRWRHLCAGCAADWVHLGGRIALRWVR